MHHPVVFWRYPWVKNLGTWRYMIGQTCFGHQHCHPIQKVPPISRAHHTAAPAPQVQRIQHILSAHLPCSSRSAVPWLTAHTRETGQSVYFHLRRWRMRHPPACNCAEERVRMRCRQRQGRADLAANPLVASLVCKSVTVITQLFYTIIG